MAPLPDYVAGTITLTNGSTAFTGSGTGWLAAGFREGDTILGIEDNPGVVYVVESVTDNDSGTLTQPWDGPTGTYTYRMRYLSDGQRVTAQARQLIEMLGNGNLQAVAGLPGTPNTLMMFTGAGSVVEVPRTDLVSGANYDVQVDTLAERAAYDGSDEGFAVLVANTGDGRAAIYSKLSNSVGDWSDPAYVTGPAVTLGVGSVTELDYGEPPVVSGTSGPGTLELDFSLPGGPALTIGSVTRGDADVTSTPVAGGFELDFTIPSQVAQGDYSGATAYVKGDVVQYQGSSWVALQDTTGNAPPSLPTTNNAYWQLLARAGNDGAGTVTTVVAGDGIDVDSTDPTEPIISGVLFDEDVQGQVPGPTEADILAGRVLKADGTWGDSGGSVDSLFLDDLTGDFDANEKAQARENIGIENKGFFSKADPYSVAFTRTGNDTISIKAGTIVEVDGRIYTFVTATPVTMPTLTAGTDYAIWLKPDGTLEATVDFTSPPVANSRLIGGFHYAPGGNATAFNTGGNTTPQINEFSIWDAKFRPSCPDPRGMALVAGSFWCDIYLLGVDHHVNGTSRYNVTIADGSSPPKIPAMFGGNGSTVYGSFNWWEAAEVMMSHGKQFLSYAEFAAAAFGVKEAQSGGTDPVSTILRANFTSKWGLMLATGNLGVWGRDFGGDFAASSWVANTGGRGSTNTLPNVARFGGHWADGVNSGSRSSLWINSPTDSFGDFGARGRSDHLVQL